MGCSSSKPSTVDSTSNLRDQPLVMLSTHYVATVNKRFVNDRMVTLALRDQFWTTPSDHEVVIQDVPSNEAMFKIGASSEDDAHEPQCRRLLLDADGVSIVGMQRHDTKLRSAEYAVVPGNMTSETTLCTFHTRMIGLTGPSLHVAFTDPVSGKATILTTRGDWKTREAVITIKSDVRRNEPLYCIARIYCDGSAEDSAYFMDIAPGVDVSLMLLVAAAMDEQSAIYQAHENRVAQQHALKLVEDRARIQALREQHRQQQQSLPVTKQILGAVTTAKSSAAHAV